MVERKLGRITYRLNEERDFSWLKEYGEVVSVIDETGSGCILFGVEGSYMKYFVKIAGARTIHAEVDEACAVRILKEAVEIYRTINHENLVRYIDSFERDGLFVVIFAYAEGECLFDHWNFDKYEKTGEKTPMERFRSLPVNKRMHVVKKLFSFFETVIDAGYVAVDFYDSSIIYDFVHDEVTFCDIDLFRRLPSVNDMGENYYGTKRLKSPEENMLGAVIDERTSEFTLAGIIFDFFSSVTNTLQRYEKGMFIANAYESFVLPHEVYDVLCKAVSYERSERYESIRAFEEAFDHAWKGGA